MSTSLEARRLMVKHAAMVERIAQWLVNLGKLRRGDFEEACSFGKVGLAEAAHSYDPARGSEDTHFWIRVYGAILTGMKRERRHRHHMLAAGLQATGSYLTGRRPMEDRGSLSPEQTLAALRDTAAGFQAALALGYLGGIWGLDGEVQLAAREEHGRALDALHAELPKLPDRDQRLLHKHYTEGIRWEEVAKSFGVTIATIERWHATAIGRLAKALRKRDVHRPPPLLDRA